MDKIFLLNKKYLIKRIHDATTIFPKFYIKSIYYKTSIEEKDIYKCICIVPFDHYE